MNKKINSINDRDPAVQFLKRRKIFREDIYAHASWKYKTP